MTQKPIPNHALQLIIDEQTAELSRQIKLLKKSEERYHKMVDEVQDYAIILLSPEGIIQNWNKGAQKIKQYEESEIIGKPFQVFYLPEDRQSKLPERLIAEARSNGRAIHEGWRLRKDGTRFWGSVTLTALHDDQHTIIGFSKVTRDLTQRKMAEDVLIRSEELYHNMIAEVQDYAIILLNEHGEVQNWNVGAHKIKGYTAEEIIGQNFRIFYPAEDRQTGLPEKLLAQAAAEGRATHEGWRVRKDGTYFWGSIVITALHGKDGKIIGYSKVTRDLTERKNAEDSLQRYLHTLEIQNKELEQFAFVASHDLQEPLRKIQTFTDVVRKNESDKEKVAVYLEKINSSAKRMSVLVNSILGYSRLSTDKHLMMKTDLNRVMETVLSDFELLIREKKAKIEYSKLPVINAIPLQMQQLFSNLLGNSLKFTEQIPVIAVSAKEVAIAEDQNDHGRVLPGHYFEISFTDNGIGFDQQYEEIIFSMFQRLHGQSEFSGTGIGLALCKKIMDSHDGFITGDSELGKGATFNLYFPV